MNGKLRRTVIDAQMPFGCFHQKKKQELFFADLSISFLTSSSRWHLTIFCHKRLLARIFFSIKILKCFFIKGGMNHLDLNKFTPEIKKSSNDTDHGTKNKLVHQKTLSTRINKGFFWLGGGGTLRFANYADRGINVRSSQWIQLDSIIQLVGLAMLHFLDP